MMTDHETRRRELWTHVFVRALQSGFEWPAAPDVPKAHTTPGDLADAALAEFDKRFPAPKQENADEPRASH